MDTNYTADGTKIPPCKVKVVFEKDAIEGIWYRKECITGHNHDRDQSIIPDQIIFYLDSYISMNLKSINNAMEVVSHTQSVFPGVQIFVPSLLHHISQRFDITHKSELCDFARTLVKEFNGEWVESSFDEF
jgi:hypothetical protein